MPIVVPFKVILLEPETVTTALPKLPVNVPLSANADVTDVVVIFERSASNVECNAVIDKEPEPANVFPFTIAAVVVNVTLDDNVNVEPDKEPVNVPLLLILGNDTGTADATEEKSQFNVDVNSVTINDPVPVRVTVLPVNIDAGIVNVSELVISKLNDAGNIILESIVNDVPDVVINFLVMSPDMFPKLGA